MKLPKGTMTGLLKTLAPLLFWMSAGWFAYPYLIGDIADAMGETLDIDEVRTFSFVMAVACIILGALFLALGLTGHKLDDYVFKRMGGRIIPCRHCGKDNEVKYIKSIQCRHCNGLLFEK